MTISSPINKTSSFNGDGSNTTFPYTFLIPTSADVRIVKTSAAGVESDVSASLYSITGLGSAAGGVVTYPLTGSPLASGEKLTIVRQLPLTQATKLRNQRKYYPDVIEDALDRLTMQIQQISEQVSRAVLTDISSGITSSGLLESINASVAAAAGSATSAASQVTLATTQAEIATTQAEIAQTYAASVNLPFLGAADTVLQVNAAGTALEYGKVAFSNVDSSAIASQAEAEAGSASNKLMTPQRTAQAIASLVTAQDFEFVSSATASNSTSLDFTGLEAGYDYVFVLDAIEPQTGTTNFLLRTSSNAGSSYDAGASDYQYALSTVEVNGPSQTIKYSGSSALQIGVTNSGGDPSLPLNGTVTLFNPANTTAHKNVTYHCAGIDGLGGQISISGTGRRLSTSAVNAVRFLMSSGNITSGSIRMYRRKTT